MDSGGGVSKKLPQYCAAIAATLSALAVGTVLGWSSPAQTKLESDKSEYAFEVSRDNFSWIGALIALGAAVICVPIGTMINITGRKLTMLLLVIPFTIGWLLIAFAANVSMMFVGRFILGIACGAFCVITPIYTAEIADKEIRGTLGAFFQLMIVLGILLVYILGWLVNVMWLSLICGAIPIIFAILFAFMPETPMQLVMKGESERAVNAIQWLRGKDYNGTIELEELEQLNDEQKSTKTSKMGALKKSATVRALVISMGLMFFQQMCGINAVIFYTTDIFKASGGEIAPEVSTIIVGCIQLIATLFATAVIDKLGRRILLLASDSIMAVSTIALGFYFYYKDQNPENVSNVGWIPILSLCVFIFMFSVGFGPVPWLMMGELFASDVRGVAGSISVTTNWLLAFIVTKTFPLLTESFGTGITFWIFSTLSIIGTGFVYVFVPETKGKTLQEIQAILSK